MKTLKYFSLSDDKKSLILLPSKVGLEIIRKILIEKNIKFSEGIEKIDKVNLIALIIPLSAPSKFLEFRINFGGLVNLYIYMENEDKLYLMLPYEV